MLLKTLIKDKKGQDIKEGDTFKFSFLEDLDNKVVLIGKLTYNEEDLAYEIDVFNSDTYTCLTYATNHVLISNVELIKENK